MSFRYHYRISLSSVLGRAPRWGSWTIDDGRSSVSPASHKRAETRDGSTDNRGEEIAMPGAQDDEIPLLTKEEAIAEVRRWLEEDKVDPEKIFAASGETTIRYKDLIQHLEQETPDGKLLLFAISRGRVMKKSRDQKMEELLQIITPPRRQEKPSGS